MATEFTRQFSSMLGLGREIQDFSKRSREEQDEMEFRRGLAEEDPSKISTDTVGGAKAYGIKSEIAEHKKSTQSIRNVETALEILSSGNYESPEQLIQATSPRNLPDDIPLIDKFKAAKLFKEGLDVYAEIPASMEKFKMAEAAEMQEVFQEGLAQVEVHLDRKSVV